MKLDLAKKRIAESEAALAEELEKVGERHRVEHDVLHMTQTLAKRSRARLEKLSVAPANVRSNGEGSSLLDDLRDLYLLASAASIDWTILGQAAQAAKDTDLLAVVDECHADQLRTLKWATTRIKETAPQALTS